MAADKKDVNIVESAIANAKRSLTGVFLFSFVVSLLLLTSPLFMLQVYDRVLLSRSESTLLGLLAVALFLMFALLLVEIVRNLLINRISVKFNNDIANVTFSEVMAKGSVSKPIHDLNSIRGFLNAPYLLSLFDIPWLPAYLAFAYLLHPMLGHIGLVGAIVLFIFAIINDRSTRVLSEKSSEFYGAANKFSEHSSRNHDAILGMGMLRNLTLQWGQYQQAGLGYQIKSADRNAVVSSSAKVVRQIIQVGVLAMGGYLAIQDITSPGAMIAASIIIGRALAPIEQSIQGWRLLANTRESYASLKEFFDDYEVDKAAVSLPVPKGEITLQNVIALGSSGDSNTNLQEGQSKQPVIKNISLKIEAGSCVGITGPSGSGKSTLIRLMLGILKPISGTVRIDGAELTTQVQRQFSSYFGFVPQEVGLFDGSVAENIARFAEVNDEKVIAASQLAGAHELILSLPEGYETPIGESGIHLSGGQKQRIALARALYDDPSLVILDEPGSNLDKEGVDALLACIERLKENEVTVVLIAHQPSMFRSMDKVALIVDGQVQQYDTKAVMFEEMGIKSSAKQPVPSAPAQNTPSTQSKPKVVRVGNKYAQQVAEEKNEIVNGNQAKPTRTVQIKSSSSNAAVIKNMESKS